MSTKVDEELPPEDLRPTSSAQITKFGPLSIARILINLFSGTGQRDPPSDSKTHHIRLITIGPSHFCEKGRWGLDLVEADPNSPIYYTEDAHPPAFCSFATVPVSRDTASATPMTVDNSSTVMYKSNVILQTLCPFLYPDEIRQKIKDMEADLGVRLGATVRCVAYHYLLQKEYYPACVQVCTAGTSNVERVLFREMIDKGIDVGMRKALQVNETKAAASQAAIRKVFDELSSRLEKNGGAYLMDTPNKSYGFTAADLTLAALAYPLLFPPEMANLMLNESELPPELVSLSHELQATKAGQHALKMYKEHRIPANYSPSDRVEIKTVGRNRNPFKGILYGIGAVGAVIGALYCYRRQ